MPIGVLARHLAELDLEDYEVSSSRYGNTLRSLSMTPGVRIVDPALSNAGRSCGGDCLYCNGCDPMGPCHGLCHSHED
jgi:hypothetical protein